MMGAAVIVFRESLEAALIIGIIAAATRGVPSRTRWIVTGVGAGVAGSLIVAAGAGQIARLAAGAGQELFNASVLGLAVAMLAWHNIWMASHGAQMAKDAKQVGADVASGSKEMRVLSLVIAVAVLREGAETVLFMHGMLAGQQHTALSMLGGGLMGLAAGVGVGTALYLGILRVPLKWFFAVTSGLILLLAAAMAGQMAKFLVQAGWLPSLATPLWNTSHLLPNNSVVGTLLHTLMGYEAMPLGMQVVFYAASFGLILLGMVLVRRKTEGGTHPGQATSAA